MERGPPPPTLPESKCPANEGILDLIKAYVVSDPVTVTAFVLLLVAATALGVVGLTKVSAALSLQVSTAQKESATKTVGIFVLVLVVLRLMAFGVDRLDQSMSTQFKKFATARVLRNVVDANRTTLQGVNPMQYHVHVEVSVMSSLNVFEACIRSYLPSAVILLATGAYLFYLDVRYGAVLVAGVALAALAFFVHRSRLAEATRAAETQARHAETFTYNVISCMDTVVARNMQEQEVANIAAALHKSAQRTRDLGLAMDVGNLVMSGAIIAAVGIIIIIGVRKLDNAAAAPAVLAMIGLAGMLRQHMGSVASTSTALVNQISRYGAHALPASAGTEVSTETGGAPRAGAGLGLGACTAPPQAQQPDLCADGTCASVQVAFEHVFFQYPGTSRPVLQDFNWSIAPGINVLCASSGSGKTTVAKLLMRQYDPDRGAVKVNGMPVCDISPDSLRVNIVFSNQDMGLLDRSIREVCLYGTAATEQDLVQVWQSFQHCFRGISLDDPVGLDGGRMSTGMKQIIRLANIRLSAAPCVILDEPFSGLDADNRAAAIALVRAMAASGRTVLLITHEPDVIQLADRSLRM